MNIKSNFYVLLALLVLVSCGSTEEHEYDTRAIEHLDKLSETIGELSSCSYTLNTIFLMDGNEEKSAENDVYFGGSDKMYIHSKGTNGEKSFWYNGSSFAYYSYDKNEYDTLAAPETVLKAISFLHDEYDIDFPASDFFYPSLTDDLMSNFNKVLLATDQKIGEVECVIIEAFNDERYVQICIDKSTNLPYRLIVESINGGGDYYMGTFLNWRINPKLSDMMFDFKPFEGAKRHPLSLKK